jgi:hypothetical protein
MEQMEAVINDPVFEKPVFRNEAKLVEDGEVGHGHPADAALTSEARLFGRLPALIPLARMDPEELGAGGVIDEAVAQLQAKAPPRAKQDYGFMDYSLPPPRNLKAAASSFGTAAETTCWSNGLG